MRPDGSHPEQVTLDEYNDRFASISPDGKWLVYIAFPADMDPGDQGSMNTPCWSPDSTRIAFVTNSQL